MFVAWGKATSDNWRAIIRFSNDDLKQDVKDF